MLQSLAHFADLSSMYSDRLVKLLACNVELLSPVVNIRGELWVDLVRIMRTFTRFLLAGLFYVVWFWPTSAHSSKRTEERRTLATLVVRTRFMCSASQHRPDLATGSPGSESMTAIRI